MTKYFTLLLFVSSTSMAGLVATPDLAIEREIRLKNAAMVSSQSVCLQDLVEDSWIQIRCRHSKNQCCLWNLNGELNRTISREDIQKATASIGLTGYVLRVVGSESVAVQQTHRELLVEEISSKIKEKLVKKFSEDPENIKVENIRISNPVYVSYSGDTGWDLDLPPNLSQKINAKIVSTGVGTQPLGWITAEVARTAKAYVATKTVRPGDLIEKENFELKPINLFGSNDLSFPEDSFPQGRRAQRSIIRGTPLTFSAIEKIQDVRMGDAVTLIIKSDNLTVTTKGTAQSSGAQGDTISVQVNKYNRTFRGRLLSGRQVEVWL